MSVYSLEQKLLFAISFLAIVYLAYQVTTVNYDTAIKTIKNNESEIVNIKKLENSLAEFSGFEYEFKSDLFNFPEKKKIVKKVVVKKPVIRGKVTWKFNGKVNYYTGDSFRIVFISGSKARINVKDEKARDYKVGDKIALGRKVLKKYINDNPQDDEKEGSVHIEEVLYIDSREVFISLPNSKALKMNLRGKRTIVDKASVPANSGELREDSSNDSRGRGRRR